MIRRLLIHGGGQHAVELFDGMTRESIEVDEVTFVLAASDCARAGLVGGGAETVPHNEKGFWKWGSNGCLADLSGWSGLLEEAKDVLQWMPMKPNAILFRTLLTACAVHNTT